MEKLLVSLLRAHLFTKEACAGRRNSCLVVIPQRPVVSCWLDDIVWQRLLYFTNSEGRLLLGTTPSGPLGGESLPARWAKNLRRRRSIFAEGQCTFQDALCKEGIVLYAFALHVSGIKHNPLSHIFARSRLFALPPILLTPIFNSSLTASERPLEKHN